MYRSSHRESRDKHENTYYKRSKSAGVSSHLPELHHVELADTTLDVANVTPGLEVAPQLGHGLVTSPLVGTAQHTAKFDLGRVEIELGVEQVLGRELLGRRLGPLVETGVEQIRLGTSLRRLDVGLLLPCVGRVGTLHAALPLGHLLLGSGGHVCLCAVLRLRVGAPRNNSVSYAGFDFRPNCANECCCFSLYYLLYKGSA